MYRLMQKYNKKMMAVLGVGLMIAFVIPQFSKSQRSASDVIFGELGTEKITAQEVREAQFEWQLLKEQIAVQDMDRNTGQPIHKPLARLLGPDQLGESAFLEIDKHPAMFLLLQREARNAGILVSDKDVAQVRPEIEVLLPDQRLVQMDNLEPESDLGYRVEQAVRDFLLVNASFQKAAGMIKVSQPLVNSRIAKTLQEIRLQLVEYPAKDYLDKVSAPTTEQVQEHFNKFADNLTGDVDPKTNPFGFGYKYPNRIKLAYIAISRAEAKKAVKSGKQDYEWEVEEQRYYKKNSFMFPTTTPAATQASAATQSGATTQPGAIIAAASSQPATKPTTRPFSEVQASILETLITPEAEKLQQIIESKITSQMREDWNAYRVATSKKPAPATLPSTSVGVPYESEDYLPKLAQQIQNQYKLVPTVASLAEKFMAQQELQDLPGIGKASVNMRGQFPLPFGIYATVFVEAFVKSDTTRETNLKVLEPSPTLTDTDETAFIFRITAADPAHKPADVSAVQSEVEKDVRTAVAYDMARVDASKLLQTARDSSLRPAAVAASKEIMLTGPIHNEPPLPEEVKINSSAQQQFIDHAYELLGAAASGKSTIDLIEVPRDSKVFVGQLAEVQRIPGLADQIVEPQVAHQISSELARVLHQQWFTYDSLVKRTNFVDSNKKRDADSDG